MADEKKPTRSRRTAPAASKAQAAGNEAPKTASGRKTASKATRVAKSATTKTAGEQLPKRATRRTKPDPAGLAEITSPPRRRVQKAVAVDPVLDAAGVAASTTEETVPATTGSAGSKKEKTGYYAAPDDTARARAAYAHTHIYEGVKTFSDYVAQAVLEKTIRLEESYNGGQTWPPLEAGKLPTGRPVR